MMDKWLQVPFADALIDVSKSAPTRLTSKDYLESGSIPIIDQGVKPVAGYSNRPESAIRVTSPLIIFGDHTKNVKLVDHDFCVGAEGVKIFAPRPEFDAHFLFQFLRTIRLPDAGYSRHSKFLQRVIVPKPPIAEQRRIAAILDQADELRRKRRLTLEKFDSLITSVFIASFGDPLTNERGWVTAAIGDLNIRIADGNYAEKYPTPSDFVDQGVPFIRAENLRELTIVGTNMRFISAEKHAELQKGHLQENDVLLTTRGRIGDVALVPKLYSGANVNAQIVILRSLTSDITPLFLAHVLRIYRMRNVLESLQTGVALKQLPIRALKTVHIPVPSIAQQQAYGIIMATILKTTNRVNSSLRRFDELYASLQHHEFAGARTPSTAAALGK